MILRDFRKKIENEINQSGLPIDAIYFVIKDIYNEVIEIYNQEINAEAAIKESSEQDAAAKEDLNGDN